MAYAKMFLLLSSRGFAELQGVQSLSCLAWLVWGLFMQL